MYKFQNIDAMFIIDLHGHRQRWAAEYPSSLCEPLSATTTRCHLPAATQGNVNFPRTRTATYGPMDSYILALLI